MGRVHLSGDIENFSDEQVDMYKKGIDFYKSYREILSSAKIYHHTDSVSHSINRGWNILQINSEDDNTIVVLGFRFDSSSAYKNIVLKGIDEKSSYKITHFPSEEEEVVTGMEIIKNGFEIYNKGKYHARAYKMVKVK
jgi:alpha-galactosidase